MPARRLKPEDLDAAFAHSELTDEDVEQLAQEAKRRIVERLEREK